jgi:hypothetical protein
VSLYSGIRPSLAALLSGLLLSASLPDPSYAGPDLRYLSFHPVPLTPQATADQHSTSTSAPVEFILRPAALPDPATREAEYRAAIAKVQSEQGEFALPLGEQLLGLGQALQEQGDFAAALEVYEASQHVLRMNLGLNSLEQVPVLKAKFSAFAAQGDVENAHAMQEALFNLRLRHHGRDKPAAVNAQLEWADWNVTLYLLLDPLPTLDASVAPSFSRFNDPRLKLAYDAYTSALQALREHAEPDDGRLVMTERKLAALNFITDRKMKDTYGNSLYVPATQSANLAGAEDVLESATTARFYDGDSALRRALAHSANQPERRNDDIAARMVELGDWYLLFDRRAAALDLYRDALQFMKDASLSQEEVERIMSPGMPVPTPDTAYLAPTDASEFDGFIDVEFELSQFGMATKPRIIGSSVVNKQIERELLLEIRDCKFRPKFVADAPVNKEKIRLRYYYSL